MACLRSGQALFIALWKPEDNRTKKKKRKKEKKEKRKERDRREKEDNRTTFFHLLGSTGECDMDWSRHSIQ